MVLSSAFVKAEIHINESNNEFTVVTGIYSWTLSKTSFNGIEQAKVNDTVMLEGGGASVNYMGNPLSFGPPSEFLSGSDWVELRGWASATEKLWYVARYKFWDNQPYTHLALSFMDRQEQPLSEDTSDPMWDRPVSNFKVEFNATEALPTQRYEQLNAFHGGLTTDPEMHVIGVSGMGGNFKWLPDMSVSGSEHGGRLVLKRGVTGTGENQVIWKPKFTGEATLEAHFVTPSNGYTASGITYEIHHSGGQIDEFVLTEAQRYAAPSVNLGTYTLDENSQVILKDTGPTAREVYAESLHVLPSDTSIDPVVVKHHRATDDNVLSIAPYAFVVQDFWQHFPIAAFSSANSFGVEGMLEPEFLLGGMGMTLDMTIGIAGNNAEALALMDAPPARTLPDWWHAVDGSMATNTEYDALIALTPDIMHRADERRAGYGWKNWGDYQPTPPSSRDGVLREDWASLQYDLATGLMMAYLRTGNPELWHRAKAAIRHQMDIDFLKFMPVKDKFSMSLYRKGQCHLAKTHNCHNPNAAFGYGWRGFLLYHHLTGEAWVKELARMSIDHGAVMFNYGGGKEWMMRSSIRVDGVWIPGYGPHRATAWGLRNLIYGAKLFPEEGTKYFSEHTSAGRILPLGTAYQSIIDDTIPYIVAEAERKEALFIAEEGAAGEGKLVFSGLQPVWSAQVIESLAVYYDMTTNEQHRAALKPIILATADYYMNDAFQVRRSDGTTVVGWDAVQASGGIDGGSDLVELLYNLHTDNRREGDHYIWLWFSTFAVAHQIADDPNKKQQYAAFSSDLYDYAMHRYYADGGNREPRPWSTVLGFPGAYVEHMLNRDTTPPATPANFQGELINLTTP